MKRKNRRDISISIPLMDARKQRQSVSVTAKKKVFLLKKDEVRSVGLAN